MSEASQSPDKERKTPPQRNWFCLPANEVCEAFEVDPEQGLSKKEARRRFRHYGPNKLQETEQISWQEVLLEQFKSSVVVLLAGAAVTSFAFGHALEGGSIIVVILLNALIGFLTEFRANRAMEALQKLGRTSGTVLRDGKREELSALEMVPGDIIILEEGQSVPADARLLESAGLQVDESPLTGESVPASKGTEPLDDPKTSLADRDNMVYRSTGISTGNGRAVVVATGTDTEIGRVGELLSGVEDEETPLERRLAAMSRKLIWICLAVAVVVAAAGIIQGETILHMIEAGVALAVAAIPEGLPAVATITLAVGMRLMARRNALVRKLPAVETLGSVTCVCTDKTGTLTRGEMTQRSLVLPDKEVAVGGSGYAPDGDFSVEEQGIDPESDAGIRAGLLVGALCNNAGLTRGEEGSWRISGDPTEGALVVAAEKAGMDVDSLRSRYPERHEFPFSSQEMNMATINGNMEGELPEASGLVSCVKGAPDRVLTDCTRVLTPQGVEDMSDEVRDRLEDENQKLAEAGYRVLALAYRPVNSVPEDRETACSRLIWIGLAGIMDPPRKEAGETVAVMTRAGVSTVMITGDQPLTARTIAGELGVASPDGPVLSGAELDDMSDEELVERLEDTEVFARVSPEHKLRILNALQERGEVCAMLGDGVNDAAALKSADIGVAMGQRGTDVAKETSDMVLLDDRFSTVGVAIHRGRIIYDNIRKFITYLFSCNLSEIFTMLAGSLFGYPLVLLPLQILWMNLITDVFPALALAAEPGEKDVMDRPPADPDEPLIVGRMIKAIGGYAIIMTVATMVAFFYGLQAYEYKTEAGSYPAVTFSFLTIAFSQLFHVFNCRKEGRPMGMKDWLSNSWVIGAVLLSAALMLAAVYVPFLQGILHTMAPTGRDWLVVIGCALAPLVLGQTWRWGWKLFNR
mgnify:CR=1 FL=1